MMQIVKHFKYLSYILRHKWFVFLESCKLGIPWQGLKHDLSKFSPTEWFPYAETFYGNNASPRDSTGAYDPSQVGGAFDYAWLHHQHCNPHHWQWWVILGDAGSQKVLPIPDRYRKEMLADWRGAGRAQRKPNTREWYLKNKDKMVLHPATRTWIEEQLGV
ncbi:hypothetical protein MTAT_19140 [Moorella thermoacetica]|uniref:Catalase n=1 Tax=Neomoorella thermoacetica TaxID=1525 RepID=A0AAC9MVF2_NEOTH|nr:DUF5662 family protein [Moorella thermoacetica]AOQ24571.1 hypothetical protein Maut_02141 [Moorella thermoacetica]TYL12672.1 hypothetical protein MTAT_19140 [Moorella thermoacetica]